MIKIAKIVGGFIVHAREPSVPEEWHSLRAMSAKEVLTELAARGADAGLVEDALQDADEHWRTSP